MAVADVFDIEKEGFQVDLNDAVFGAKQ